MKNEQDVNGLTPLSNAVLSQDISKIMSLLAQNVDLEVKNLDGETALHIAAREGYSNIVNILLKCGSQVNTQDDSGYEPTGYTPLHEAAKFGHVDILNILLEYGADVNLRTVNLRSPLYLAVYNNNVEIIDVLSKPLFEAVEEGKSDQIQILEDDILSVDLKNDEGMRLIAIAAEKGHVDIVKFLLDNGARLDSVDMWGWSPLHSAVIGGNLEMVKLFIEYGLEVDENDYEFMTPLHYACLEGNKEIVQILLEHGADRYAVNDEGRTSFDMVKEANHLEILTILEKS